MAEVGAKEDSNEATANACMAAFAIEEEDWFLDLGASSHVIGNAQLLTDLTTFKVPSIKIANA